MSRSSSSGFQFPFSLATGWRLFFLADPLRGEVRAPVELRLRQGSCEDVLGLSGALFTRGTPHRFSLGPGDNLQLHSLCLAQCPLELCRQRPS